MKRFISSQAILLLFLGAVSHGYAHGSETYVLSFSNISHLCSEPVGLRVQLTSLLMNTHVDLKPKEEKKLGIFSGWYELIVSSADGAAVERTHLISAPGCRVPVGCPYFMPTPGKETSEYTYLDFYNTTKDCGNPITLRIAMNGRLSKTLPPGKTRVIVPKGRVLIEILQGNKRLLVTCIDSTSQHGLFYGCTNPFFKERKDGLPVLLRNSTYDCGPQRRKYLTYWIDGIPIVGLGPGRQKVIRIEKGPHRFQITEGLWGTKVFNRLLPCSKPFMVNYGCKR